MKVLTLLVLAAAAAALVGCRSPGYSYELRVAPSASLLVADEAAWGWEEATKTTAEKGVSFEIVSTPYGCSGDYCIYIEEVPPADVNFSDPFSHCASHDLGCTLTMPDSQSSHTKISDVLDAYPWQRLATYAHEIGHALGLNYEPGPDLMDCKALHKGIEGPTPADVEQFYAVRGVGRPGFAKR
jgi:hypothetical protein